VSRPTFHAFAFGPQGGMAVKRGEAVAVALRFDVDETEIEATGHIKDGEPWARVVALDQMAPIASAPERVLYDGPWAALLPAGPAGPASPLPAAEIGQAGSQGQETEVREIFGGWRFALHPVDDLYPPSAWSLPYATERAARAGAREAIAAAFRLRAAEAKAAELATEIERLCWTIDGSASQHLSDGATVTAMLCRDSAAIARALLARLGFRPGQP
jgi:hypothetical protein